MFHILHVLLTAMGDDIITLETRFTGMTMRTKAE